MTKCCESLDMANVDRRHFDSAQLAFEALNGDTVPFSRLERRKLIQLRTALSAVDRRYYSGGTSVSSRMHHLLRDGSPVELSSHGWKCVKIKDSEEVCFFSDSYAFNLDKAITLDVVCRNVGLDVRIFEWYYPTCDFGGTSFRLPTDVKIVNRRHEWLCRGKLVGFVLGAYNNASDIRVVKKRRRNR